MLDISRKLQDAVPHQPSAGAASAAGADASAAASAAAAAAAAETLAETGAAEAAAKADAAKAEALACAELDDGTPEQEPQEPRAPLSSDDALPQHDVVGLAWTRKHCSHVLL